MWLDAVVAMPLGSVMLSGFVSAMALDARVAVSLHRDQRSLPRSRQAERTGQDPQHQY